MRKLTPILLVVACILSGCAADPIELARQTELAKMKREFAMGIIGRRVAE